jgi:E3 ubiquitin-protein ligase HERC2
LLESLAGKADIVKLTSHPDARHYLALSKDGMVYSWGSGDVGALGLGDTK